MVYLTRVEKFNAAHKLWVENWSEEKNKSVFGKCSNKNWHGHNYSLHITVKGEPHPDTGFIIDAKVLSKIVNAEALDYLDHSNLNLDVPFLDQKLQPTSENLIKAIWERIEPSLSKFNCKLHRLVLHETDTIYVEYYGE